MLCHKVSNNYSQQLAGLGHVKVDLSANAGDIQDFFSVGFCMHGASGTVDIIPVVEVCFVSERGSWDI